MADRPHGIASSGMPNCYSSITLGGCNKIIERTPVDSPNVTAIVPVEAFAEAARKVEIPLPTSVICLTGGWKMRIQQRVETINLTSLPVLLGKLHMGNIQTTLRTITFSFGFDKRSGFLLVSFRSRGLFSLCPLILCVSLLRFHACKAVSSQHDN